MSEITNNKAVSPSIKSIKVQARDEVFRIVQLRGNLFVCSKQFGSCCCGWTEKGRASVNTQLYEQEWADRKLRNKLHLTFSGCLGPCAVGNNVLLQLDGRSIWFSDLNSDHYIPVLFDYIEGLLVNPLALLPPELASHVYERYLPAQPIVTSPSTNLADQNETTQNQTQAELDYLDVVCLMEVDPQTARWKSEYANRTFYFCAPACRKAFDKEPLAYL